LKLGAPGPIGHHGAGRKQLVKERMHSWEIGTGNGEFGTGETQNAVVLIGMGVLGFDSPIPTLSAFYAGRRLLANGARGEKNKRPASEDRAAW